VLTEYSANSRFNEADEARYLDELLHAWFSHPSTVGFTSWGFKDDIIWTDNAFLFRKDWSLKPAGEAWLGNVFGEWWTEEDGRTNEKGRVSVRGFKGDYQVEVRHAGKRQRAEVHLGEGGQRVVITMDETASPDEPATRLGSYNPWTTGKLPSVTHENPDDVPLRTVRISSQGGAGAVALVPESETPSPGVFSLYDKTGTHRDAYVRFDLSALSRGDQPDRAVLHLAIHEKDPESSRIRIHALSPRFESGKGESGLDWSPRTLSTENAPGRASTDGGFDLGDARVLYVGDLDIKEVHSGAEKVEFSNRELRRLVGESVGRTLTLILSAPDAGSISFSGPGAEHSVLPPPELELEIPVR
jgi:hypothetical protein